MIKVDCERGCASFSLSCLSFPLKPGSRYYGVIGCTIKLSQTLSFLKVAAAQLWGGGEAAAVTVGAEMFLYLDC